jgi:hypothetical protein
MLLPHTSTSPVTGPVVRSSVENALFQPCEPPQRREIRPASVPKLDTQRKLSQHARSHRSIVGRELFQIAASLRPPADRRA